LGGWGVETMEVKVLFFGVLSEVSGTAVKHYQNVRSVSDLKRRIQDDVPELAHYNFRISVNSMITDDDLLLKTGDEIALLPPFAGG
jgi:molybdopterin synthase sulfur carrier subunit